MKGANAVMPTIVRKSAKPYRWTIGNVPLADVANKEKKMPRDYITSDGFGITDAARRYLEPLIARRGTAAHEERPARVRSHQGCAGEAQAHHGVQGLKEASRTVYDRLRPSKTVPGRLFVFAIHADERDVAGERQRGVLAERPAAFPVELLAALPLPA